MYDGRPFHTLNVIDEGNREALCIECGMSIPSARLLRTMERLVEAYGTPQAIQLDNGPDPATSNAPFRIFNIGNNNPVKLSAYIEAIEAAIGKKAIKDLLPLQAGDVPNTFADSSELEKATGYKPATPVTKGVAAFVQWYRQYFQV